MSAAPADHDAGNGCTAFKTWLPGALVGLQLVLEFTGAVIGVAKVIQGGAQAEDGGFKDAGNGCRQAKFLLWGEGARGSEGVDAGLEQGFVRVYVSDPGQDMLVQENGLDGAL